MGKSGQPVDVVALEARRKKAVELLSQGYSHGLVAKSVGMSKTWVSKISMDTFGPRTGPPRVRA